MSVLLVAESWAVPIEVNVNSIDYKQHDLMPLPDTLPTAADLPAVYRFVERLPASSVLIELPFGEVAFETRYMFYSTFHWRRLVNGYSGGGPGEYGLWAERFKEILAEPEPGLARGARDTSDAYRRPRRQLRRGPRPAHQCVGSRSWRARGGRLRFGPCLRRHAVNADASTRLI